MGASDCTTELMVLVMWKVRWDSAIANDARATQSTREWRGLSAQEHLLKDLIGVNIGIFAVGDKGKIYITTQSS
jgi:hypothetical protein